MDTPIIDRNSGKEIQFVDFENAKAVEQIRYPDYSKDEDPDQVKVIATRHELIFHLPSGYRGADLVKFKEENKEWLDFLREKIKLNKEEDGQMG